MALTKVSYSMISGAAVNLIDYGIQYTASYDETIAKANKTAIETALRNTDFSDFIIPANENPLYICGSIHPLRGNMKIWQQAGCNIIGYSQNAGVSFAGHLFGFVQYQDPDAGNFTITGTTENVVYVLDGDIQTAYSASTFGQDYNNNAIGFSDSYNCQVIGTGGISKCNHVGINFDGDADKCYVDINYVKDCSTLNIQMIGISANSYNTVKAKLLSNNLLDDTVNSPNSRGIVLVGGNKVLVDIDYIDCTKAFPILRVNDVNEHAHISFGSVDGNGSQLIRMYNSKDITVYRALYSNLQYIVSIAGASGDEGTFKNIVMQNVNCTNASDVDTDRIIDCEITPNSFERLIVRNCNFGLSTGFTDLFDNLNPAYCDLSNTKLPSTYNYTNPILPPLKSIQLAEAGDTSFVVNSNNVYGVITNVNFQLIQTGVNSPRYVEDISLVTLGSSDIPSYKININSTVGDVTITKSGSSYTFTAPAGYEFTIAFGYFN